MKNLVKHLTSSGIQLSQNTKDALLSVDRAHFCSHGSASAYEDYPQYIGYGATISAPHMHAIALESLHSYISKPNARILDVGSGSGYLTACFAFLARSYRGHVYGVEHVPELVERARESIKKSNPELLDHITLVESDGFNGLEEYSPFSCIHVGASCTQVPEALLRQLDSSGAILIPLQSPSGDQQMTLVTLSESRSPILKHLLPVRCVCRMDDFGVNFRPVDVLCYTTLLGAVYFGFLRRDLIFFVACLRLIGDTQVYLDGGVLSFLNRVYDRSGIVQYSHLLNTNAYLSSGVSFLGNKVVKFLMLVCILCVSAGGGSEKGLLRRPYGLTRRVSALVIKYMSFFFALVYGFDYFQDQMKYGAHEYTSMVKVFDNLLAINNAVLATIELCYFQELVLLAVVFCYYLDWKTWFNFCVFFVFAYSQAVSRLNVYVTQGESSGWIWGGAEPVRGAIIFGHCLLYFSWVLTLCRWHKDVLALEKNYERALFELDTKSVSTPRSPETNKTELPSISAESVVSPEKLSPVREISTWKRNAIECLQCALGIPIVVPIGVDKLVQFFADELRIVDFPLNVQFRLRGHRGPITQVGRVGSRLVSSSFDGSCRIWNLDDGSSLMVLDHPGLEFSAVATNEEGIVISGSISGDIVVWSREGRVVRRMKQGNDRISQIRFVSTDRTSTTLDFVCGSYDGTIWRWSDGRPLWTSLGHGGESILSMSRIYSKSDGDVATVHTVHNALFLIGTSGGLVKVCDCANGEFLEHLRGHQYPVWTVEVFGDGGNRAISGDSSGFLILWNLTVDGSSEKLRVVCLDSGSLISLFASSSSDVLAYGMKGMLTRWDAMEGVVVAKSQVSRENRAWRSTELKGQSEEVKLFDCMPDSLIRGKMTVASIKNPKCPQDSTGKNLEQYARHMECFLAILAPSLARYGGIVLKITRDSTICVFAQGDFRTRCEKAILSSISIASDMGLMASNGIDEVERKIAISTFEGAVAFAGPSVERIALGDVFFVASLLENLCSIYGSSMLISEPCKKSLSPNNHPILFRFVDHIYVKGKEISTKIYEVINADPPHLCQLKTRLLPIWKSAIKSYRQRNFSDALCQLNEYLQAHPTDRLASIYRDKCLSPTKPTISDNTVQHGK